MDFPAHIRRDAGTIADISNHATPGVAVPSCPEWDLAGLVGHVGGVHRWVTAMVAARATERAAFPEPPTDWQALRTWFGDGVAPLLAALDDVGPDEKIWNWADRAPAPSSFWPRRMAHETAVHRWDAENAVHPGAATPIDAELAADGIDEYLGFVRRWLAHRPREGLHGRIGLGAQTVVLHPDHIDVIAAADTAAARPADADADANADATLRGTPSDVLLYLSGRRPPGLTIEGDQSVLDAWPGFS